MLGLLTDSIYYSIKKLIFIKKTSVYNSSKHFQQILFILSSIPFFTLHLVVTVVHINIGLRSYNNKLILVVFVGVEKDLLFAALLVINLLTFVAGLNITLNLYNKAKFIGSLLSRGENKVIKKM